SSTCARVACAAATTTASPASRSRCAGGAPRRTSRRLPQDLRQLLPPGELVDQLVEVADVLHQRILDVFDPDAAHHALDQRAVRMERGCLVEEGAEVGLLVELLLEAVCVVAGEPGDDLVDLRLRALLALGLLHVHRVDAR